MGRILASATPLLLLSVLLLSACGGKSEGEGMYYDPHPPSDVTAGSRVRWDQVSLVFPVVGAVHFENDFHDARDGGARLHEGNDLISKKLTPVVAVADGEVSWVRAHKGGECCYLEIEHESEGHKFYSRYIHLNNDTPGTDDGQAVGIAKGIRKGKHVLAGELIGWVGDSGNAENTVSHLHFELRDEFERAVNPYHFLLETPHLDRVRIGEPSVPTKRNYKELSLEGNE